MCASCKLTSLLYGEGRALDGNVNRIICIIQPRADEFENFSKEGCLLTFNFFLTESFQQLVHHNENLFLLCNIAINRFIL